MCSTNRNRNMFLTLDGHNDPALNIGWLTSIKKGKIWHKEWYNANKALLNEKINYLDIVINKKIINHSRFSNTNKHILDASSENLKELLVEFIKDGKIFKTDEFASLLIALHQKHFKNLEISYYIRLIMEMADNELIYNILCLSDLKKKKHFPHGFHNYRSDFLQYSFYKNYKKDIQILKLLHYKTNRKANKKSFNLNDCIQYKYFDKFKIDSYEHDIDYEDVKKNREIISNELRDLWFKTKWKNEETLFRNLKLLLSPKNITPIKWHKNEKLKNQHLDIYFEINKKKYGIEYQGAQHFKPIKFFGGKKALNRRIKLDRLKKFRCSRANINLITFNYNEPIDKKAIETKLKRFGISFFKERRLYV